MYEDEQLASDADAEALEEKLPPPIPTGLQLTALNRHFRGSPYDMLADMRERDPVHRDNELNRCFLSRHDDVRDALLDDQLYVDPSRGNPGTFAHWRGELDLGRTRSMPFVDDPDHARLRGVIGNLFAPDAVAQFRPNIKAIVTSLLDELEVSEFEIESIGRYSAPIATRVMAEFLGIDPSRHRQIRRFTDASFAAFYNPYRSEDEARAGLLADEEINALFRMAISAHNATGDNRIGSMLRAARGVAMSEEEIVRLCNLLLVVGCVNTADLITNGIRALLQNTKQMTRLGEHPELIDNTVEEILRFDSPVVGTIRIADRDMAVGECPISKGETISISIASANRDEIVYPNPNRFDIDRLDTHHLAFGAGRRTCPGAALARAVATDAIVRLVVQFPQMELSPRGWEFASIPEFRRMKYFWIRT